MVGFRFKSGHELETHFLLVLLSVVDTRGLVQGIISWFIIPSEYLFVFLQSSYPNVSAGGITILSNPINTTEIHNGITPLSNRSYIQRYDISMISTSSKKLWQLYNNNKSL